MSRATTRAHAKFISAMPLSTFNSNKANIKFMISSVWRKYMQAPSLKIPKRQRLRGTEQTKRGSILQTR
jgi:hypothetical protein